MLTRLACQRCNGTYRDRDGQRCPECEQVERWLNEISESLKDMHESEDDATEVSRGE